MAQRFVRTKTHSPVRKMIISLLIFALVLVFFSVGMNVISAKTAAQEKTTLETAIHRQIAHCYAIEGSYPENLAYLMEHYGLLYDSDRFFVDYHVQGANIMPDVTIIDKEGNK